MPVFRRGSPDAEAGVSLCSGAASAAAALHPRPFLRLDEAIQFSLPARGFDVLSRLGTRRCDMFPTRAKPAEVADGVAT